jgi:glycosyltransferase involved in cell wall biosynthesis
MKIGFFLENNKAGGMDTFVKNLLSNWPNKNDELVLFSNYNHPGLKYLKIYFKAVKNVRIETYKSLDTKIIKKKNLIFYKIIKYLNNILIFNKRINSFIILFKKIKIERIFIIQGGYPGGQSGTASIFAWSKLSKNKPWFNFHNFAIKRKKIDLFKKYIDYKIKSKISGFVSVSKSCTKSIDVRKDFKNLPKKTIYNGLEINSTPYKNQNKNKKINLLMLGVYEERKGHDFLFKSLLLLNKYYTNFECNIYGDGTNTEIKNVLNQIPTSLKNKIKLNKHTSNINSIISKSDILLVPSQELESFGYSALEAMSFKKSIVSTNCGGLPEVINNNITGYIVAKNDKKKFAQKILFLIKNIKKRNKMGMMGYKRYKKYFSSKVMAKKYSILIKK